MGGLWVRYALALVATLLFIPPAHLATAHVAITTPDTRVERTIPLPGVQPFGLLLDAPDRRGFVFAETPDNRGFIGIINVGTGQLMRRVIVPDTPGAVAVADGRLLVTGKSHQGSLGTVSILEARSGALIHVTPLDMSGDAIAVDGPLGHAFVETLNPDAIAMLDARTGAVLHTTPVPSSGDAGLAVDARSDLLFASTGYGAPGAPTGGISVLNARTGALLRTLPVAADASRIILSAAESRSYVINSTDFAQLIDTRHGTLLGSVFVGSGPLLIDDASGHAFGNDDSGPNLVRMVDARSGRLLRVVNVGVDVVEEASDPTTHRIFVRSSCDGMAVLNSISGALLRTTGLDCTDDRQNAIASGNGTLAVDEARQRVYAASLGPTTSDGSTSGHGNVAVLDAGNGALIQTIAAGVSPIAIAADRRTGRVFVVDEGGEVQATTGRTHTEPGGVIILDATHT